MDRDDVLEFAKKHDYKDVTYLGKYKDVDVYFPTLFPVEKEGKFIMNLPPNLTEFILVIPNKSIISLSDFSLKLVSDIEIYKYFFTENYKKYFFE